MRGLIILICLVCALGDATKSKDSNESRNDDQFDIVKMVSDHKYPINEYSVTTADGYILKIHRIQCRDKHLHKHKSVLIMGDYLTSSLFWVMSGPKHSLGYYLADLGYDVWLGNNRGSKYGQDGVVIKPKDPKFWYFSFHEYGVYDLPAIIDFILAEANHHKINYIGWGYGATQFFVMASEKPEYVKKITNMQALAPTPYIKHVRSEFVIAMANLQEDWIYKISGRDVVISDAKFVKLGGRNNCLKVAKNKKMCDHRESMALESFDTDIHGYPEVLSYPKVQAPIRCIVHIHQQSRNGFRHFDNGEVSNRYFYGTKYAPKYNIAASDLPIALYYSDGNMNCSPKDVLKLKKKLPNVIRTVKIDDDSFGHIDYAFTKNGQHLYYKSVKEVLEMHH